MCLSEITAVFMLLDYLKKYFMKYPDKRYIFYRVLYALIVVSLGMRKIKTWEN